MSDCGTPRKSFVLVIVALVCLAAPHSQTLAEERSKNLSVTISFPGGSAAVEGIDQGQRLIRIRPSHHPDRGWECWWYFKVEGITPGETLTLDLGGGIWATPDQCFFSLDRKTWTQTAQGTRGQEKGRIVYRQRIDAETAWFAWGPPFVPEDAQALVDQAAKAGPWATTFELCTTRGGRAVPALRVKEAGVPDEQRIGIWIQARQHAWETGSSWVCKGFVDWLVSDDSQAVRLRRSAEIVIVPIMDVDNVAIGAGGKNEVPQDHNRDWTDHPHWRSVEAAQHEILKMNAENRFDLFVDLHNPAAGDRSPFFFVAPRDILSDTGKLRLKEFLAAAQTEMTGPLAYRGRVVESDSSYDKNWKTISKNWVTEKCAPHVVSLTLETSWNTPDSTAEGYQHVGRGLGRTIAGFFETRLIPGN